jgi:hypothetical protein
MVLTSIYERKFYYSKRKFKTINPDLKDKKVFDINGREISYKNLKRGIYFKKNLKILRF